MTDESHSATVGDGLALSAQVCWGLAVRFIFPLLICWMGLADVALAAKAIIRRGFIPGDVPQLSCTVQIDFASGTPTGIVNATVLSDAQTTYDILGSTWMAFANRGGTRGNFGSGTNGTALDLFRVLGTLIGANPTGLLREGSYEGTFHITDAGVVSYTAAPTASAVPEPSHLVFLSLGVIGVIYRRRRAH
jgi:hypothetical protein